ncbi:protein CUSTOS isoform X1 [Scophthalmus maximus]|uniref:Protein CUSTOS n=1 Tax=Scophthalmus maximus TaxID=52904 RepID=A0A8D3B9Q9_SCOMX|nr:protein CUSTOS isoform X1 [Scophthalmus maximus]
MAAAAAGSAKNMVGGSDNSSSDSSDDDEARRRCREAVWETRAVAHKEEDNTVKQSKRFVVAEHEHDGNELQVTQGFRTHVAKKLGHLLDSYISETQIKNSSCVESAGCDDDDEEGFRLFSTSVPGQTTEEPPVPVRRRPVYSSSDSDSEMETRLREAAVSVKDLLPSLTLPSTTPPPSSEPPCSGQVKEKEMIAEGEEGQVVKKKKKKKRRQNPEESAQVDCARCPVKAQSNGEHGNVEQEQFKAKRKKKKKRQGNTMDEAMS